MLLNDLDDDCLMALLKRFSVQERIHLRLICPRWNTLIMVTFRSVHSIKLFQDAGQVEEYARILIKYGLTDCDYYKMTTSRVQTESAEIVGNYRDKIWHPCHADALNKSNHGLPSFSGENSNGDEWKEDSYEGYAFEGRDWGGRDVGYDNTYRFKPIKNNCNFLVSLFPHVKILIVCFNDTSRVNLAYLLPAWSRSLTSISLMQMPDYTPDNIFQWVNSITSLVRLDLLFTSKSTTPQFFLRIKSLLSSVLPRLEHFSIAHVKDLTPFIRQLGAKLRRLELHHCCLENVLQSSDRTTKYKFKFSPNLKFMPNLHHLTITPYLNDDERVGLFGIKLSWLEAIVSDFTNLKSLSFMPHYSENFLSIVNILSKMVTLNELKIYYHNNWHNYKRSTNVISVIEEADKDIVQLPNINKFQLEYSKFLNTPEIFFRIIPHIFPNITFLQITERCLKPIMTKMKMEMETKCASQFGDNLKHHSFQWIQINHFTLPFSGLYSDESLQYKRRYNAYTDAQKKGSSGFGRSRWANKRIRRY